MENHNYPNAEPSKAINQTEVKPRSRVLVYTINRNKA